jgi:hypothetical protein
MTARRETGLVPFVVSFSHDGRARHAWFTHKLLRCACVAWRFGPLERAGGISSLERGNEG